MIVQRIADSLTAVFWASVPLFGVVQIVPWMRLEVLQDILAVVVSSSALVLLTLTYHPAYVSRHSVEGERGLYFFVLIFVFFTFAL